MNKDEHRDYIVNYGKEIVGKLSELSPPLNISLATLIGQLTTHLIERLDNSSIHEQIIRCHIERMTQINLDNYFESGKKDET